MSRPCHVALAILLAPAAAAQGVYDFDGLNGSDTPPFTLLDGQDGWSEETFNANNRCGVTETLSHDGTKSLQFQEVGPGFGCDASRINDANWGYSAFTGLERDAYFQADMRVGFWGGSFGVAHDTNDDGIIRGYQGGERGVRFTIGTQSNVQLRLIDASGNSTQVPLGALGVSGGNWVRVRVVMDLAAGGGSGTGTVWLQNLTAGTGSPFTPVPGLQDVPLGLVPGAGDATDPTAWDAVWLHFEGATYGLDNMEAGTVELGSSYCASNPNSTGATGVMQASGSPIVADDDLTLEASQLPAFAFGFFLTSRTQFTIPNPGGSEGVLCLGGAIGRFVGPGQILNAGTAGRIELPVSLSQFPQGTGLVQVLAGETWSFQAWHRDFASGGANTSNFTNGLAITFQ